MRPEIYTLFVYGSLRSGFHHPAYTYISKYFTLQGNAQVRGILCDMGNFPVAVPAQTDAMIVGELYTINRHEEFSWAIAQLDDYEGLNAEPGEIAMYKRELVEVLFNDQKVQAWIYWYNGDVTGRPIVPSGDVLLYMKEKKY